MNNGTDLPLPRNGTQGWMEYRESRRSAQGRGVTSPLQIGGGGIMLLLTTGERAGGEREEKPGGPMIPVGPMIL